MNVAKGSCEKSIVATHTIVKTAYKLEHFVSKDLNGTACVRN